MTILKQLICASIPLVIVTAVNAHPSSSYEDCYINNPAPTYTERLSEFKCLAVPIANHYGVDYTLVQQIAKVESSFRSNVKARTSSAEGYFQVVDKTWSNVVSQYNVFLELPKSVSKTDKVANIKVGTVLLKETIWKLSGALGKDPTDGEVYLAHFLGLGSAIKVLSHDDITPLNSIKGLGNAIKANASIMDGKTVGDLKQWASLKMLV